MPYLYRLACETAQSGVPMMRAMILEFDQDETCAFLDRQYMLGDALLVAPIFNADGIATYYLPDGKWTNILTGETLSGGKWQREKHGYMTFPLLARQNSIIALGRDNETMYDYTKNIEFHIFALHENETAKAIIYDTKGEYSASLQAALSGSRLNIEADGLKDACCVVLRNIESVSDTHGLKIEQTKYGIKIYIGNGASCVEI
jgi:alpha-D-xyloside xylohydrolase